MPQYQNHALAGTQGQGREVVRHVIARLYKLHPQASQRDLAKQAGCSRGVVQKALANLKHGRCLDDAPKSGRPRVLQGKDLDRAVELGVEMPVGSSRTVSEQLASEGHPSVHDSTVRRAYRREGVRYGRAKRGFVISEKNRLARLAFATTHGEGKTDLKYQ